MFLLSLFTKSSHKNTGNCSAYFIFSANERKSYLQGIFILQFSSFELYIGIISLIQAVAHGKYPLTDGPATVVQLRMFARMNVGWGSLDGDSLIELIKYLLTLVFVLKTGLYLSVNLQ